VSGLLVSPLAPDELSDALVRLAQDKLLRLQLGAAGRERAMTLFRKGSVGSNFAVIYEAIFEKRGIPEAARIPQSARRLHDGFQ
jgi:glycosyltransferase involved in cell wall biosynthesis